MLRLASLLTVLVLFAPAAAQIRSVTLQPPTRDYGYFPGDLVASTSVITVGPETVLDTGTLPYAGPITGSVDLRNVLVSEAADADGRRITIRTEYQNFASPDEVSRIDIPGYQVAFTQGHARLIASVPGFDFAVSPFRHDLLNNPDPAAVRPDHPFATIDVSPSRYELITGGTVALLAFCLLALDQGWLPWLRRGRTPFAEAFRIIRRNAGGGRELLVLLHRAFDETAGERVLADDLDRFLARHARFAPLRADIQTFFENSRKLFFAAEPDAPLPPVQQIARLSRDLARAERG